MDDSPQLCRRCAAEGSTCCQGRAIVLTSGDVERIQAHVPDLNFFQFRTVEPDKNCFLYDAVWEKVFGNGENNVRIVRHDEKGNCCFLRENGCCLSMEVRPLVCRLYPYDYNNGTLKGVYGHLCPQPERDNGALLLALLGMNRERAESWRILLYREIMDEFSTPTE